MPMSYGMKSHKCQGLSLLWASGEDEWLFRPIGECSAGLWFPFCVKFGQEPKWQARTAYHDRVWSHAFPMLSHTKQWGLPQLALSPLQLPPPVHVLALCHCTKPPFSSPRFLHMGNHYQMRTLCLRVLFLACSFVYCHLFACCLFSSLFRTMVLCRALGGEYVHILLSAPLSPNCTRCPWTVFSHIMPWSHTQSREELISACSSHTGTSVSMSSWPLTFLIAVITESWIRTQSARNHTPQRPPERITNTALESNGKYLYWLFCWFFLADSLSILNNIWFACKLSKLCLKNCGTESTTCFLSSNYIV